MDEKEFLTAKKKSLTILSLLLLLFLGIAVVFMGLPFLNAPANKGEEVFNLSELIQNGSFKEGQNARLEINNLPILITPPLKAESQFYYVMDANNRTYIANLSTATFKRIAKGLDLKTGKLATPYEFKGVVNIMDKDIKKFVLSSSYYNILKRDKLNPGDFYGVYLKENYVNDRVVTLYKISALFSLLFLIIALGYVLPSIVRISKGDFGIRDESIMARVLQKYLPADESLVAGIYGIGIEVGIKQIFENCAMVDGNLVPDEDGVSFEVSKSKYSKYDVYFGITKGHILLSECEECDYLYEFNEVQNAQEVNCLKIDEPVLSKDIGKCFALSDIQNCIIQNGIAGSMKCTILMKNGSFIKLVLPKYGGPGMMHQAEYRDIILNSLRLQSE